MWLGLIPMRKKVLVLGGNFGGLTAALSVKRELQGDVDVRVVSASDRFLFKPSLIWLLFGRRRPQDITFPLGPTLDGQHIDFVHGAATFIDPVANRVETTAGTYDFDYLVIATGSRNRMDAVPGLAETDGIHTITTLDDAVRAAAGWRRYLDDPGPVVVAAASGAGCFAAAYEFIFAVSHQLRKAGLTRQADLTFVTAEPYPGHFGIGGLGGGELLLQRLLAAEGITVITGVATTEVVPGKVVLSVGDPVEFSYAMIISRLEGQDVVGAVNELADEKGFVTVHDTYQSMAYPHLYAVGAAVAMTVPWTTAVPVGVPKDGFPVEAQSRVAAKNIAAQILGGVATERITFGDLPACVLDAGDNGVLELADRPRPAHRARVLIPAAQASGMRVLFEKYFLWRTQSGQRQLP